MNVAKTAEQRAIEETQWTAKKVAYVKGLKSPSAAQTLFAQIAQIEPASRTPKQARQLAAYIKVEKLADRTAEARATMLRLATPKRVASSGKAEADKRKILMGAMLMDQMKKNPAIKPEFMKLLNEFLTRPADRALFDFEPPEQNSLSA